jgi:tetratricopeptide (TPR) repeat protein
LFRASLGNFLNFTGRWDELLSLVQQAEAKAVAAGDHHSAGLRPSQASYVYYLRQQADAVLACADRMAAHWQTAQAGTWERATALRFSGYGHPLKADYPAAIAAFRESLDLLRTLSAATEDVAVALHALGAAERDSGDLAVAERDYREALRMAWGIGLPEGVATCTGNLAELAPTGREPRPWPARPCLLSEKLGRQELIASNSQRLAQALVRQGTPA